MFVLESPAVFPGEFFLNTAYPPPHGFCSAFRQRQVLELLQDGRPCGRSRLANTAQHQPPTVHWYIKELHKRFSAAGCQGGRLLSRFIPLAVEAGQGYANFGYSVQSEFFRARCRTPRAIRRGVARRSVEHTGAEAQATFGGGAPAPQPHLKRQRGGPAGPGTRAAAPGPPRSHFESDPQVTGSPALRSLNIVRSRPCAVGRPLLPGESQCPRPALPGPHAVAPTSRI